MFLPIAHKYGGFRTLLRCIFCPQTFNEKIQRLKIFGRDPRFPQRADKILVKDFVRDRLDSDWVTPTLWHGEFLPPLGQRTWSIPFVIKANNGSGWNIFVRQKSDLDWPRIESLIAEWHRNPYGADMGEWHYGEIKPALLVEPFIGEGMTLPRDYKLWTFSGKVKFIEVVTDQEHQHKCTMFDPEWHRLPFSCIFPSDPRIIAKPLSLNRMIGAAEVLAEDFPFVRIDLYEVGSRPRFGEITFYPASGYAAFIPPEWDIEIGKLWR